MTELLTAAQMRAIEQAAIASGEVTGLELMERAGRGVVEAIFEEWPELAATSHRAVVLCGPGNNGGDGFVVARLLKDWGWEVEVFLYGNPEKLPPDARVNYERWLGMGEVQEFCGIENPPSSFGSQLVVDALFGIGLSRPLENPLDHIFPEGDLRGSPGMAKVVSIDVPSGLCADSGRDLGRHAILSDLTVTFQYLKVGQLVGDGPALCSRVVVKDIGIEPRRMAHLNASGQSGWILYPPGAVPVGHAPDVHLLTMAAGLGKQSATHKYSHGHALILSGPSGRGGAARLAARGSLRIGAGVVTVGCPLDAIPEHAARLEAVMLRPIHDADALARVLEDGRINALCLGPGMGTGDREAGLLAVALGMPVPGLTRDLSSSGGTGATGGPGSSPGRGLLLDADALTILSQHPDLFAALHGACVLTPHAGEFSRLFPDIAAKLAGPATRGPAYSKVDATREAAARAGCVVLLKGPDTVIADPSGRAAVNSAHYDRAAPWLATAGSGDVLAGFITGLLARGFPPFDAACTGAWLHVECALGFGPGLIAEDLADELPKVFRALGI